MSFIELSQEANIARLKLSRGKANALNNELVSEIRKQLSALKDNPEIAAVVLEGKYPFFSAGLDLIELYDYNVSEMKSFWKNFHLSIVDLLKFPKPIVAAITGHSPAGGCILALCCDYRIMSSGPFKIGLNEVPVGIVVPEHIYMLYSSVIGKRLAYQYLIEGKLITTDEAYNIGLIDKVASPESTIEEAIERAKLYSSFGKDTWSQTKLNLRAELLKSMEVDFEEAFKKTLDFWWSEESRQKIKGMIDELLNKKKSKQI